MPAIQTLSIALSAEVATVIQQAVDAGEYASQNEVVSDALREWTHKRKLRSMELSDLRNAWLEAVVDDSDGEDPDLILDTLENKYDAMAQASGR